MCVSGSGSESDSESESKIESEREKRVSKRMCAEDQESVFVSKAFYANRNVIASSIDYNSSASFSAKKADHKKFNDAAISGEEFLKKKCSFAKNTKTLAIFTFGQQR